MSAYPKFDVSKDMGMESSDMEVKAYASRPALLTQLSITTAGVVFQYNAHAMVYQSSIRTEPDFLAFAASQYTYWRGSIKLMFHFIGTPFFSCRFKVSVTHSGVAPSGGTADGAGYYSRVVDVKGDAICTITVPYLHKEVWRRTNWALEETLWDGDFTYVTVEALTDVQGAAIPSDAIYYCNVYRASGPDFQLAEQQKARNIGLTSQREQALNTTYKKQCSINQKFKEPFEGVSEISTGSTETGLLMADTASTISDSIKRGGR